MFFLYLYLRALNTCLCSYPAGQTCGDQPVVIPENATCGIPASSDGTANKDTADCNPDQAITHSMSGHLSVSFTFDKNYNTPADNQIAKNIFTFGTSFYARIFRMFDRVPASVRAN